MGNLHHQGYGSSSLWGLCNTHTNYNLNDGAAGSIFHWAITITNSEVHKQPWLLTERYSLALEVLRKKWVVMGKLRVPALTRHTLGSDVHCASVIRALPLDTGCCRIGIRVPTGVGFWQRKKKNYMNLRDMQTKRREMLIPTKMCLV